jgi:hypothetical protein
MGTANLARLLIATGLTAGGWLGAGLPGLSVASASTPSLSGCGYDVGTISANGGAGTEDLVLTMVPDSPFESCTTTVAVTATITPTQPGVRYTNIDGNPLTTSQTVTFAPGRVEPEVAIGWSGFYCADPAVPGTVTFSVAGAAHTASMAVDPSSCSTVGPPFASSLHAASNTTISVVGITSSPDGQGYQTVDQDGVTYSEGDAAALGSAVSGAPVVGMQSTPSGQGDWLAAADGGVFTLGDAPFYGSAATTALAKPVTGIASTPDGKGYWLVASDGGVFAYGDAGFYGSTAQLHLNSPVVGIAPTADGKGYWLVASDGGVFAFGDAAFDGSAAKVDLAAPIMGIAAGPDGGYWLVGSDGGVFAYGSVGFYGSAAGLALDAPISGIAETPDGHGYWLVGANNGIFTYGDAQYFGHIVMSP